MELNYKLCEATLHDSLTKRRSLGRTELNVIINIAIGFAQLNFILDRFKKLVIGKNIWHFIVNIYWSRTIDYNVQYRRQDCSGS